MRRDHRLKTIINFGLGWTSYDIKIVELLSLLYGTIYLLQRMTGSDQRKKGIHDGATTFTRWMLLSSCLSFLLQSFQSTSSSKALAFSNVPLSATMPRGLGVHSARRSYRTHHKSNDATATSPSLLFAASTERSCIELTDPETGCQVVLVGCFHGSPSSAQDVQRECLPSTDAIVLELCASRFAGLRKSTSYNAFQLNEQQQQPPRIRIQPPRVIQFFQNVGNTIQTKGLSTGVASGILGGVSGLQTALSGFTPGLEFTTALEFTQQPSSQQQQQQQECDIILADQLVDETIEKVGKLPRVIRSMMEDIISGASSSWEETQWSKMAAALRTALAGDPTLGPDYQVNVGQVMTRNAAVIQELSRLMIPPVLLTQLSLTLVNDVLLPIEPAIAETNPVSSSLLWNPTTFSLNSFDPAAFVLDALPHVVILSFMLTLAYSFLAVPVTQVILYERDNQLTRGIQSACRLAASKHSGDSDRPGRVVAVLGLLHINGVAQRLLATNQSTSSSSAVDTTTSSLSPAPATSDAVVNSS